MSRQADRRGHEVEVRVSWLEEDMDRVDKHFEETTGQIIHKATNLNTALKGLSAQFDQFRAEHKAEMKELREETAEEIGGNRKLMTGLLVSMLLAAVSFATVIITMRGGG